MTTREDFQSHWSRASGIENHVNHHVHQVHICNTMRLIGGKEAWVHQAHDTEQLHMLYMVICLTHHEKQASCT